jgi:hypothetical protein
MKILQQKRRRYQTRYVRWVLNWGLLVACFLYVLTGCGGGAASPIPPVRVEQRGDSITHQAGQMLADYLPTDSVVINMGVDGAMARDIGTPAFRADTVHTFSYGVNECIGAVSPESYRETLNHLLAAGQGYKIVLEAPWRVVDPRCNPTIDQYRAVVVELGVRYGVPVVIEDDQTHIGEGLHLPESHMRTRAQLLAAAILKL